MIGVNTAIATAPNSEGVGGGGSVGVGFAIPMTVAVPVADSLISTGRAGHPDLGLSAQATIVPSPGSTPGGLYVTAVSPGGPAAQAGISPGDIVVEVDGEPATSVEQLVLVTLRHRAGDRVPFVLWRAGARVEVSVTLGAAP
ncbi:hypothetical protein GCM10009868_15790 [Terrabacter aerolatus]|uniref:PDZ domain-containing protein n=1 Tax=Terrabacter aerolatus TaxID=422442 RepID=A0A512D3S6_9MICO|nr:PDZ domain-containing protein [Terrabacter aerolatus]GEO31119.1 hypothetical protein TAE01_29290 [Terrabacter aerolatus]